MGPYFNLPEVEISTVCPNSFQQYFRVWYDKETHENRNKFNTYEDAICYVYNMTLNNELELSLESMIKLTREYNKI